MDDKVIYFPFISLLIHFRDLRKEGSIKGELANFLLYNLFKKLKHEISHDESYEELSCGNSDVFNSVFLSFLLFWPQHV